MRRIGKQYQDKEEKIGVAINTGKQRRSANLYRIGRSSPSSHTIRKGHA